VETEHNYVKVMLAMIEVGEIPQGVSVHQLDIYHDDDCSVFAGGFCDCEPVVEYNLAEA